MLVLAALLRADQTDTADSHPNVFHAFESTHDFLWLQHLLHATDANNVKLKISEEAEAVTNVLDVLSSSEVSKGRNKGRLVESEPEMQCSRSARTSVQSMKFLHPWVSSLPELRATVGTVPLAWRLSLPPSTR